MNLLYNIGVRAYGVAVFIASAFNKKAHKWFWGRRNWRKLLHDTENREVIWFHCASLGEFDQGLPLMTKIKAEHPEVFLLVTFFSPSGFENFQKREFYPDGFCYLPLDTQKNARDFIQHYQPKKTFFVKYEFWGNYILEAKKHGSEIYNVSGLFRPNQRFFKWHGSFFRTILQQFDHFFVQNETSKELLRSIEINQVSVAGDSRFDRVMQNRERARENGTIARFKGDDELIVIGSSWPQDEAVLIPWINETKYKVLIAPHEVDDKHVDQIISNITRKVERYSEANKGFNIDAEVLVLNTIGHLSSAYIYGKIAYVGGGFSGSLHNILEPAVFGLPVIFGPKHTRFPEAQSFIDGGFGFSVQTTEQFKNAFEGIISNLESISEKEQTFVEANAGASERIYLSVFGKN